MGVMQQRASMNMLLTLRPYRLEKAFWSSGQTRRRLMIADAAACVMALIHASIMVYRVAAAEPGKSIFNFYFGPRVPLFSLGMQKIMYQSGALLLLLTIIAAASGGRDYYTQHRHAMCLMNRLLRLLFSSAQLMSSGARNYLAPSLALRTQALQQRPWKALMIMTLHPVIFWMMQAQFVLPWRIAVIMQLANTAVALSYWSSQLPCYLHSIHLQLNFEPQLFYQQQASELCRGMQYLGSGLCMSFGDITYALQDGQVCEGLRAVQVLQTFATLVGLLVLPLSVKYGIERRFKRQFLQLHEQAEAAATAEAAAADATAAGSSSSRTADATADADGVTGAAADEEGAAAVVTGEDPQTAVVLRWVACVSGLLIGAWLLAELLVTVVYSRVPCDVDG